jgi:hypothetical protein
MATRFEFAIRRLALASHVSVPRCGNNAANGNKELLREVEKLHPSSPRRPKLWQHSFLRKLPEIDSGIVLSDHHEFQIEESHIHHTGGPKQSECASGVEADFPRYLAIRNLLRMTAGLQFLNWDVFVIRLTQEEMLAFFNMTAERGRTNQQIPSRAV